jgi:hypothetical protein
MGNSFQFFSNRMSNYSNIADKQLFNYSNIAVDIRFIFWQFNTYIFLFDVLPIGVFICYIIFLKLFSMLDYFNLSSFDNWKTKQKLQMLFCAGMSFTVRISGVTPTNNRFFDKHTNEFLLNTTAGNNDHYCQK